MRLKLRNKSRDQHVAFNQDFSLINIMMMEMSYELRDLTNTTLAPSHASFSSLMKLTIRLLLRIPLAFQCNVPKWDGTLSLVYKFHSLPILSIQFLEWHEWAIKCHHTSNVSACFTSKSFTKWWVGASEISLKVLCKSVIVKVESMAVASGESHQSCAWDRREMKWCNSGENFQAWKFSLKSRQFRVVWKLLLMSMDDKRNSRRMFTQAQRILVKNCAKRKRLRNFPVSRCFYDTAFHKFSLLVKMTKKFFRA